MNITLEIVKENLIKLIKVNPSENYKIGRCLSLKEISDFENKHLIKLPKEYVEFVTKIGSFGYGPNYGLRPLSLHNDLKFRTIDNDLKKPFPFTEKKDDNELYNYECDSLLNGSILISDCGCGDFDILVVNGEEFGNVWGDYRVSCNGMVPLSSNEYGNRLSFLEWYNADIERKLALGEQKIYTQKIIHEVKKEKNHVKTINKNVRIFYFLKKLFRK